MAPLTELDPALEHSPEIDMPSARGLDSDRAIGWLRLLFKHRQLLLRNLLLAGLTFALISLLVPNQYKSTARLMPPDENKSSGLALLTALAPQSSQAIGVASDMLGMKTSGAVFVAILQSRTVQDDLINRFDLRRVYWVKTWEDARKKLGSRTDVSEERKSGVIEIDVNDTSKERAQSMTQEYVDELNRLVSQLTTSSAHRERVFLEERLRDVKHDLDAAAINFSQFASKNTAIDIPEQGKAMVTEAAELQGELIAAESQLSEIEQIYSSSNIRARSLKARIEELRHQLEIVGGKDVNVGDPAQLDASSLYPSIRKLPLLGVAYSDLYRRVKMEEAIYEVLTKQYELAKVEEAKEIPSVRVLDKPEIPEKKSFPPRLLITFFGSVWFVGMTVFWITIKHAWFKRDARDPLRVFAEEMYLSLALSIKTQLQRLPRRTKDSAYDLDSKFGNE